MIRPLAEVAAGLALLTVGAELLIAGASGLASRLGVPRLVVGLTVVAFGTSAPELTVSTLAAWRGQADLALGNVVGSNTYNVLFILGLCAVLTPLAVSEPLIRVDVPAMVLASALTWWLASDGVVTRPEGALLLGLLGLYLWRILRSSGGEPEAPEDAPAAGLGGDVGRVVLGLLALVGGTHLFVEAAVALARGLGVSELVIGLTVVAAGTSMPETATSLLAAWRGERDMAVGNVVGSNLFNLLGVLGPAAVLSAQGLRAAPAALAFDLPVMVLVAAACLPLARSGGVIDRREGAALLLAQGLVLAFLVGRAQAWPGMLSPSAALGVVALALAAGVVAGWGARPASGERSPP